MTSTGDRPARNGTADFAAPCWAGQRSNLEEGATGIADPVDACSGVRPGSGVLVIARGPDTGAEFPLTRAVTVVGRDPSSGLYLEDLTVSRHHAEFRWLDGEYWIVDTGSINGTFVNGELVQALPLTNADEIQLGKFRLTFTCEPRTE